VTFSFGAQDLLQSPVISDHLAGSRAEKGGAESRIGACVSVTLLSDRVGWLSSSL
jgi:hypothetical protein